MKLSPSSWHGIDLIADFLQPVDEFFFWRCVGIGAVKVCRAQVVPAGAVLGGTGLFNNLVTVVALVRNQMLRLHALDQLNRPGNREGYLVTVKSPIWRAEKIGSST